MAFTDVFGGELIFPSLISYLAITTAVDITLQWPTEQQITDGNVVADVMDITTSVASLNIDMPDTRVTAPGNKTTINNVGGETFTVRDNTGGTIQSVAPGEQWVLVLTDNTTIAGTWTTFQLGAQVAVASASALAGAGIKAILTSLNQKIDSDEEPATPITVVDGDRAKALIYTAGAGVANLPDPGAVGNDWFFMLRNSGSGTLNVLPPSGLIDGTSSINLQPGDSAFIFTDGTNFFTIGLSSGSTLAFDFISLPVPGSGDFVLSGANLDRISYRFTGALTGNRRIVVPNTTQQYWCDNQTTGAFQLTISTNAQGSPPELEQGETAIFYCDSVNVIVAVNATTISLPLAVTQGGTGAINPTDARNNLEAAHDELDMIAGAGLIGGGLLQADVTFQVGAGIGVGVNADDVFLDFTTVSSVAPAAGDFIAFQDIDDTDITKKATLADIVAAVPATANELVDTSANVRVRAELLGVAQLRSDGNVDAEVRLLEFAHSDGTPVALVGQPAASIDFNIANLAHGGLVTISAENAVGVTNLLVRGDPDGITELFAAGVCRFEAQSLGKIAVRSDGNTDAEDRQLVFDHQDTSDRGRIGYIGDDILLYKNEIHGGHVKIQAEDTGGIVRDILEGDPDANVKLFNVGVETFRTIAAASGGAEANNLSTGAGFERVLTTADLGGGGAYRGAKAFQTGIASWPLNNTPNFAAGGPPGLAETAAPFNTNVFDTEGTIHSTVSLTTRFVVPVGTTKVILRAGAVINGDTSGGYRHMRFRLNGTLSTDPNQGNWVAFSTNSAAGSGSWWGTIANSGVITVANPGTDYFEVMVLRQNSSGFTIANTVWMEMELVN